MNHKMLKIIGIITMTLDHIGVILLDQNTVAYYILRALGRIAFFIFAYMISEGFFKTRDVKKYFLRLFFFAVIIELFVIMNYVFTGDDYILTVNVIWPLVFGLGALICLNNKNIFIRLLAIGIVFLAEYISIPYGAYGVLMIIIFALYRNVFTQFLFAIGLNLLFINQPLLQLLNLSNYAKYDNSIQWFSLLAFIFIFFYNGKKAAKESKWFFYIYYPLHLGILFGISYLIF